MSIMKVRYLSAISVCMVFNVSAETACNFKLPKPSSITYGVETVPPESRRVGGGFQYFCPGNKRAHYKVCPLKKGELSYYSESQMADVINQMDKCMAERLAALEKRLELRFENLKKSNGLN